MAQTIAKELLVQSEQEMHALGAKLAQGLRAGDVVFLMGEMGMGKSVLARAIARAFGVQGAMPSHSFTILQSYEAALPVKHFDLYRLEDPAEFYEAGLDEEMDEKSLSLVEWPEMADFRPEPRLEVRIKRGAQEDSRVLQIDAFGMEDGRANALCELLAHCPQAGLISDRQWEEYRETERNTSVSGT